MPLAGSMSRLIHVLNIYEDCTHSSIGDSSCENSVIVLVLQALSKRRGGCAELQYIADTFTPHRSV